MTALLHSMLDAGLPRKEDPEDQKSDVWTAPSYFDVALGGLSEDFGGHAWPPTHAPCPSATAYPCRPAVIS